MTPVTLGCVDGIEAPLDTLTEGVMVAIVESLLFSVTVVLIDGAGDKLKLKVAD